MIAKLQTFRRFVSSVIVYSPKVSGRAAPNKGFTRLKETSHFQIGHASSLGDEVGRWSWFTFPREGGGHGSLVTSSSMLHRHKKGGERSKPGHGDRWHLYTLHCTLLGKVVGDTLNYRERWQVVRQPPQPPFYYCQYFPKKVGKEKLRSFFSKCLILISK